MHRTIRAWRVEICSGVIALAALACGTSEPISGVGERNDPIGASIVSVRTERGKSVQAAGGFDVDRQEAVRILEVLARSLALSLQEPVQRDGLRGAMMGSSFREHKLPFGRVVRDEKPMLLSSMARASGRSLRSLGASLDSTANIEVYMPVKGHLESWDGSTDVLVAFQLEDGDSIIAYSPSGVRVVLSPDQPPSTPTIVLVKSETDFTPRFASALCTVETCDDTGGGGSAGGGSGGGSADAQAAIFTHLYMTSLTLDDLHEGWPRGNPEIEVFVIGKNANPVAPTARACAGEHPPVPSHTFDMNAHTWSGSVRLANSLELSEITAQDSAFTVAIWEDDSYSCTIYESGKWTTNIAAIGAGIGFAFFLTDAFSPDPDDQCVNDVGNLQPCTIQAWRILGIGVSLIASLGYFANLIYSFWGAGDDFVGVAASSASWNAVTGANVQEFFVILEDGQQTGTMAVEFRTSAVAGN